MSRLLLASALFASGLAPLGAETLRLRSELPDYEVAMITALPTAPADRSQECRSAPPSGADGKRVQAAGWQVISETTLEGYDLVSFAASSSMGAEGVCEFESGNLGVFKAGALLGLFFSPEDASGAFGALRPNRDGVVQMSNAYFPVVPIAELTAEGGEIALKPLPATLPECGGKVDVPQAWLAPIGKMRAALLETGWTATAPKAADPIAADLQAQGFPETESCSGTGQNYCSYEYANAHALLRVITLGELAKDHQPIVSDYEVTCWETPQ